MTLEEYAGILGGIEDSSSPFQEGEYKSHTTGNVGYRASYRVGKDWLWYSVSDTSEIVLPSAVVKAVANGQCQRAGLFKGNGFEARVRFAGQSYMLGVGSKK